MATQRCPGVEREDAFNLILTLLRTAIREFVLVALLPSDRKGVAEAIYGSVSIFTTVLARAFCPPNKTRRGPCKGSPWIVWLLEAIGKFFGVRKESLKWPKSIMGREEWPESDYEVLSTPGTCANCRSTIPANFRVLPLELTFLSELLAEDGPRFILNLVPELNRHYHCRREIVCGQKCHLQVVSSLAKLHFKVEENDLASLFTSLMTRSLKLQESIRTVAMFSKSMGVKQLEATAKSSA